MKLKIRLSVLMVGLLLCLPAVAAERGTPAEGQALVAKAIEAFNAKGADAFEEINAGALRDRDLYIFVYSTGPDAKVVAYGGPPVEPPVLGKPSAGIKDVDGLAIGDMFQAQATPEGAWVDYRWKDPATGEAADKSSWLVRSGDYIFGAGVYKLPD